MPRLWATDPYTFTAGETISSWRGNTEVRDRLQWLHSPTRCIVQLTASVDIADSTWEAVDFSEDTATAVRDVDGIWNDGNGRFTIPRAGIWTISVRATFAANSTTDSRRVRLRWNDSTAGGKKSTIASLQPVATASVATTLPAVVTLSLAAGDFFEVEAFQDSGAELAITAARVEVTWRGGTASPPSWTTPRDWTNGETITAAILNTHWRDEFSFLYGPPGCGLRRDTDQTGVLTATWTAVTWESAGVEWNLSSTWDSANPTRLVAPIAGRYLFTGQLRWSINSAGNRGMRVRFNGSASTINQMVHQQAIAGHQVVTTGAQEFQMAATDYLEVFAFQDSGSTLSLTDGSIFGSGTRAALMFVGGT